MQKAALQELRNADVYSPSGEPSLQNALELAQRSLKHTPSHAARDVLVVMASLTTCDPGNIFDLSQVGKVRIRKK